MKPALLSGRENRALESYALSYAKEFTPIEHSALPQPISSYLDETRDDACYQSWVAEWDTLGEKQLKETRYQIAFLGRQLNFSVIPISLAAFGVTPEVHPSLAGQLYTYWESVAAGHSQQIAGDYVIPLPVDAILPAHALFEIATELVAYPDTMMLFTDEDWIDSAGQRHSPHFRTAYDPDLMLGLNAVGSVAAYRRDLFQRVGGLRLDLPADLACYDLALRAGAAAAPETIRHLPAVLCHRNGDARSEPFQTERTRELVRAFVGDAASVVPAPLAPRYNRIVYKLPNPPPLVSVIVPIRDRAGLVRVCADAVLNRTSYHNLELLIADNGSIEPETHALLANLARDPRVHVLSCPGPFNWSAINNAAAAVTRGEILVFLNNDIDLVNSEWLCELVSQVVRPEIGVVGARLLYPDGRVQHGGIVIMPGGWPMHVYRFASGIDPGYLGQLATVRGYSAVTGACMAMRRTVFDAVGGFEDRYLAVTFNDVDLCLRVRASGWRVICTPFAEVIHHELATRGPDDTEERQERFRREKDFLLSAWGLTFERDPFCSPNLSFEFDALRLARPPRLIHPWRVR